MVIDFIFCLLQVVLSDLINKKQIFFKQFSLRAWIFIRLYICMFTVAQFRLTNFRVAYCLLLVTFYVKVIILSCSFSCVSSFTHSSLQYLLRLFRYGLSIRLNACCTHGCANMCEDGWKHLFLPIISSSAVAFHTQNWHRGPARGENLHDWWCDST